MRPPSSLPSACIAASLRILTGMPRAAAQSKPTQPVPRFHGSSIDRAAEDRAGNADGDGVVFPVGGVGLDAGDDLLRRKPVARIELARLGAARMHQLDVGSADVND